MPPTYLPYQFLHNMQPFLLLEKVEIIRFFLKQKNRIKIIVVTTKGFALTITTLLAYSADDKLSVML